MPQHVVISDYDPAWPEEFRREAAAIARILGDNLTAIHHIGSTAVPGLAAKPIIDIMPVVRSLGAVDGSRAALELLGYEYLGEFGIPGRRYMRKGGDERTHQVHVFAQGDTVNITRHLAFRDFLRAHPDVCAEYALDINTYKYYNKDARTRTCARNTPRSSGSWPRGIHMT